MGRADHHPRATRTKSSAGLTAEQLQQLLHLRNVKPHLTRLIEKKLLVREKMERRFVYFARPEAPGRRQKQQRKKELEQALVPRLPPLEQIIALLVEIIRRPQSTPRQWARQLSGHGTRMSAGEIQAVLDYYHIDPKKRALDILKLRWRLLPELPGTLPAACQLPDGYVLEISSGREACQACGARLRRCRTSRHRPISLMLGRPQVRLIHQGNSLLAVKSMGWRFTRGKFLREATMVTM